MKKMTVAQARDTGLALVLIVLLADMLTPWNGSLVPATAILVLTMTWPAMFRPAATVWFGFSHLLGTVASKILLGIIFYGVATPIGLIRKLAGADSMRIKQWKTGTESVFIEKNHQIIAKDLETPY